MRPSPLRLLAVLLFLGPTIGCDDTRSESLSEMVIYETDPASLAKIDEEALSESVGIEIVEGLIEPISSWRIHVREGAVITRNEFDPERLTRARFSFVQPDLDRERDSFQYAFRVTKESESRLRFDVTVDGQAGVDDSFALALFLDLIRDRLLKTFQARLHQACLEADVAVQLVDWGERSPPDLLDSLGMKR